MWPTAFGYQSPLGAFREQSWSAPLGCHTLVFWKEWARQEQGEEGEEGLGTAWLGTCFMGQQRQQSSLLTLCAKLLNMIHAAPEGGVD